MQQLKPRRGNMNTFPVRCGFHRTMTSAIHRLFLLIVTVIAFTVSAFAQDVQKLDPALAASPLGLVPSWSA